MLDTLAKTANRLTFRLRETLRPHFGNPLFIALTRFYFRHALGAVRRFIPLYGITAVISITYRCQCACVHCGAGLYRKDRQDELTPEEILAFIDRLGQLGAAAVHFFGGEPLLAAQLPDYVRRARARGMKASVDSNGLLLDEAMVLRLKEAGIDIVRVSLDSPEPGEHDALRGVPGVFGKAVEGLRLCRRHGLDCSMSLYATSENLADGRLEKLIALGRSLGVKVRILSSIATGKWLEKKDAALSREEIDKLRGLLGTDVCWETEFLNSPGGPFWCNSMIRNKFDVSAYGDIQACCYLPITYGNIRKEPVEGILKRMWGSEMFLSHRDHFDCPINSQDFDEKYGPLMRSEIEKQAASRCGGVQQAPHSSPDPAAPK